MEPDPTGRVTYKPHEKFNIPRDIQFKKENEEVGIPISPTDDIYEDEKLSQISKHNSQIPQTTSPPKNIISKAFGNALETGKNLYGRKNHHKDRDQQHHHILIQTGNKKVKGHKHQYQQIIITMIMIQ